MPVSEGQYKGNKLFPTETEVVRCTQYFKCRVLIGLHIARCLISVYQTYKFSVAKFITLHAQTYKLQLNLSFKQSRVFKRPVGTKIKLHLNISVLTPKTNFHLNSQRSFKETYEWTNIPPPHPPTIKYSIYAHCAQHKEIRKKQCIT
jgi:hypothetical protein